MDKANVMFVHFHFHATRFLAEGDFLALSLQKKKRKIVYLKRLAAINHRRALRIKFRGYSIFISR